MYNVNCTICLAWLLNYIYYMVQFIHKLSKVKATSPLLNYLIQNNQIFSCKI